jgi:hypothetical protein
VAAAAGCEVVVALFVGVAAGFAVVPAADGVAAGTAVPPPRSAAGIPIVPTESLIAGGVIERTAPSPVTVPAAIKNAFFISVLSRLYLRGL